jgi:hypothetical protein
MKKAAYKLYNCQEIFNKEYSEKVSIRSIADDQGIYQRIRLVEKVGNTKTYRADKSGYYFSVTLVN